MGVRFALTSEPGSNSTWNDSRVKGADGRHPYLCAFHARRLLHLLSDAQDHRSRQPHAPACREVTHAIRRRMQMVSVSRFRAAGRHGDARAAKDRGWRRHPCLDRCRVEDLARRRHGAAAICSRPDGEYLVDNDLLGQWLDDRYERIAGSFETLASLHQNHRSAGANGKAYTRKRTSRCRQASSAPGFQKRATMAGKVFDGLRKSSHDDHDDLSHIHRMTRMRHARATHVYGQYETGRHDRHVQVRLGRHDPRAAPRCSRKPVNDNDARQQAPWRCRRPRWYGIIAVTIAQLSPVLGPRVGIDRR